MSTGTQLDGRRDTGAPSRTGRDTGAPSRTGSGAPPARPAGPRAVPDPDDAGRRFAACAALTAPVLLLTWFPLLRFPHWPWVVLALALPVVAWGALPVHRAALARAREGTASVDTLVSAAVLLAVGASVPTLLAGAPGEDSPMPLVVLGSGGSGRLHLEVAAAVTTAVLGARVLTGAAGFRGSPPRIDRVRWFVPAVLVLAAAAGGFWAGAGAGRPGAVAIALAVLVAACPVAVVLAEPAAVLAAVRVARWRGVVGVGPEVLGSVRRVTTVLLTAGALTGEARPDVAVRLRGLGLDPVLLTADPPDAADALAARSGIDAVAAGLPPREQVAAVRRLQDAGCVVAVVGGAGDGPVLAAADVGLSLVPGPAGVVLPAPDPDGAVDVLDLGRRTGAVARSSTGWALAVAAAGVPLAAGGLLHPTAAVALLAAGSALVAVRSLTAFHGADRPVPITSRPSG